MVSQNPLVDLIVNQYTLIREDSHKSILLRETFFALFFLGGGDFTQECFSNFSNNQFFQAEKLLEKPYQQGRML